MKLSYVCNLTQKNLSEYAKFEMNSTLFEKMKAHLSVCPECQRELNKITKIEKYLLGSITAEHETFKISDEGFLNLQKKIMSKISDEFVPIFNKGELKWCIKGAKNL